VIFRPSLLGSAMIVGQCADSAYTSKIRTEPFTLLVLACRGSLSQLKFQFCMCSHIYIYSRLSLK
jgi:hypothetical protein